MATDQTKGALTWLFEEGFYVTREVHLTGGIPTGQGDDPDLPKNGLDDATDQASTYGRPNGATMVIPLVSP